MPANILHAELMLIALHLNYKCIIVCYSTANILSLKVKKKTKQAFLNFLGRSSFASSLHAPTVVCQWVYSYFLLMNSRPLVVFFFFLSCHKNEKLQQDMRRSGW